MKILENIVLDIPGDIGKDFLTRVMGGVLIPKMEELLDQNRKAFLESIDQKGMYEEFEIN
jgi:hypothetical protein